MSDYAVIFDMDGVLIDSVGTNWRVYNQVLKKYGIQLGDKDLKSYIGSTLKNQIMRINADYKLNINYESFEKEVMPLRQIAFETITAMPGAKSLLQQLSKHKIPLAVATSSPRAILEDRLGRTELISFFSEFVTEEDVRHPKPDPEAYIKAAQKLGISTSSCVVIEDAPSGIESAHSAGMKCCAVMTAYTNRDDLKTADLIADSLEQIKPANLRELIL